jgi:heat shock protein HslJ
MKMTRKNFAPALAFSIAVFAVGCGSDSLTGPSAIVGGVWKLQSLQSPSLGQVVIPQPSNYTVEFKDSGQLAVKADCNSCSGSYSISGDSLTVGALACTQAFCGSASFDTAFLAVLTNATTFAVTNSELTINSTKGVAKLKQ